MFRINSINFLWTANLVKLLRLIECLLSTRRWRISTIDNCRAAFWLFNLAIRASMRANSSSSARSTSSAFEVGLRIVAHQFLQHQSEVHDAEKALKLNEYVSLTECNKYGSQRLNSL